MDSTTTYRFSVVDWVKYALELLVLIAMIGGTIAGVVVAPAALLIAIPVGTFAAYFLFRSLAIPYRVDFLPDDQVRFVSVRSTVMLEASHIREVALPSRWGGPRIGRLRYEGGTFWVMGPLLNPRSALARLRAANPWVKIG